MAALTLAEWHEYTLILVFSVIFTGVGRLAVQYLRMLFLTEITAPEE